MTQLTTARHLRLAQTRPPQGVHELAAELTGTARPSAKERSRMEFVLGMTALGLFVLIAGACVLAGTLVENLARLASSGS